MADILIDSLCWFGLEPLLRKTGLVQNVDAGEARFDSKTGKQIKDD
ncbi:MAG TPA: hypothetical protein VJM34_00735 [Novosphingobium sp.]|nr:hypothetical protein [Novosphingobium sp.]